jgi:hypothetical protein
MGADKTGTTRYQRIIKVNFHMFPLMVNFPIQPVLDVNIYFISDKERFPQIKKTERSDTTIRHSSFVNHQFGSGLSGLVSYAPQPYYSLTLKPLRSNV